MSFFGLAGCDHYASEPETDIIACAIGEGEYYDDVCKLTFVRNAYSVDVEFEAPDGKAAQLEFFAPGSRMLDGEGKQVQTQRILGQDLLVTYQGSRYIVPAPRVSEWLNE